MCMKKQPKQHKPKEVSNPASTGGAGTAFENRVQASRLLAMCLGDPIPGKTDGRVIELRFQARVHGHHTDDLVCTFEDHAAIRSRVLLQMKRTVSPRETNEAFCGAVGSAWIDFTKSAQFTAGQDTLFLIYDGASSHGMTAAAVVTDWARRSANVQEFEQKVAGEKFSNPANRNALTAIRAVAKNYAGREISNEEVFEFAKHLNFYPQDLDREGTAEHVGYLCRIKTAAALAGQAADANEVWAALIGLCVSLNKDAATVTFDNLSEVLGSRLNLLFASFRHASTSLFTSISAQRRPPGEDVLTAEVARMGNLLEAVLRQRVTTRAADDMSSAARESSLNRFVSSRLDAINQRIKALRYTDAFDELQAFGQDQSEFDTHQRARWLLMRGACRWHLEDANAAADDFIAAAEVCDDDDKLAAARVRGLLLNEDVAGAIEAGKKAAARFPDSLTVWLIYANARSMNGEVLGVSDIPEAHVENADAWQVIAWAKHKQGDLGSAVETVLIAIAKPSATFFTRNAALTLALEKASGDAFLSTFKLVDQADQLALETAVHAFSPRGQRLWDIQTNMLKRTTQNLAVAHLLLNEPDEALAVISEARSHGIDESELVHIEMDALNSIGKGGTALTRGKAELHRLPKEGIATFAQLAAEACYVEGIEAATQAAGRLEPREPQLEHILVAIRWETLARTNRGRALEEVQLAAVGPMSSTVELAVAARILLREQSEKASVLVDIVAARLPTATEPSERYFIAQLMFFAKRWDKAAEAYESILSSTLHHSALHNDLLYCYIRLGQRVKAKELLDSFSGAWETSADSRTLAIELGQQAGDWSLLSRLVPAQLSEFPNTANSWLFKLMVTSRLAEHQIDEVVAQIPERLTGKVRELSQIASMEIQHGQKDKAMRRLYAMRRSNMDSLEAASAHLIPHLTITDDLPFLEASLDSVVPGSSVTLVTGGGASVVYTIDPTALDSLPNSQEFVRSDSEIATVLMGAKVGSQITITADFGVQHVHVVTNIQSAYRRLLDLSQLAHNAPLVPSKYAASVPIRHDKDGKADFSGVEAELKRSNDRSDQTLSIYRASPITLGGVSKMLGRNVLDIVRGWPTEGPPLHVGTGNKQELELALGYLQQPGGVYVVDAATLAELAFVERLDLLATLPKVYVASATRDLVEGHLAEVKLGRSEGVAYLHEGRLAYREFTEQDRKREVAVLQAIADAIRTQCHVAPAYGSIEFASLASQVQGAVSDEEHAVLLLGIEKNATLLAMDARLRSFALGLFELRGVWPQALLAYALKSEALSQAHYSLAVIKWFLANRTFVSVTSMDLAMMAYQGTDWLRYGIKVLKAHISSPDTEFESAAGVGFEFLQVLANGHCHVGPIVRMLQHISEALHRHKDCPKGYAVTLTRAAQSVFASENSVRAALLEHSVWQGAQLAQDKEVDRPLNDVKVLMCSDPPFIAYARNDRTKENNSEPLDANAIEPPKGRVEESATVPTREASERSF